MQGPRAQADRKRYQKSILDQLESCPNLSIVEGEVVDLFMDGDRVAGVSLEDGSQIRAAQLS